MKIVTVYGTGYVVMVKGEVAFTRHQWEASRFTGVEAIRVANSLRRERTGVDVINA